MMKILDKESLVRFQHQYNQKGSVIAAVADTIGGTVTPDGLWRFFGHAASQPGIVEWNSDNLWKSYWGNGARDLICIGEDIFGNQLVCIRETADLLIWDHESASLCTLEMTPEIAIEAVFESGLGWIDYYENGSLQIGLERLKDVPESSHLHWTTPLILGGAVTANNTSVVERVGHLVGHGKLWQQIQGLPPGSPVIIKPP